jgi:hypothetical protein
VLAYGGAIRMALHFFPAPGLRRKRLAACVKGLARAAGHQDSWQPLMNCCQGLLLPIERNSVEPKAARLAPDPVRRMYQSFHHIVGGAPWQDAAVLDEVRQRVLAAIRKILRWRPGWWTILASPREAVIRWRWPVRIADNWANKRTGAGSLCRTRLARISSPC